MSEFKYCATCKNRNKDTNKANITSFAETSPCNSCYSFCDERTPTFWMRDPEVITIADSGDRREFPSGAVRDMAEGKGRCDLMPLDVVAVIMQDLIITEIASFVQTGEVLYLYNAINRFEEKICMEMPSLVLELAQHFEAGAKKYGENNWQKGLPIHCYIDSGVRHYLKWLRGDDDEPHHRAFVWNLVCCIWTCIHKPELNDYRKGESDK